MARKPLAGVTYALAAVCCSLFLCHNLDDGKPLGPLLVWTVICGLPLFFVFAYPRFVFSDPAPSNRASRALVLNSIGSLSVVIVFPVLALPFWKNPMNNLPEHVAIIAIPLSVLTIFLVAGISLLFRGKSSLAVLASVLFWPYWLVLALLAAGRFFNATALGAVCFALCFVAVALLMFAAGAVSIRPAAAHAAALIGLVSTPWLYSNAMRDYGLGNVWLVFNESDPRLGASERGYAASAILAVALTALALATAAIRLLPSRWQLRKSPVRDRTWPAVLASFVVVAIWFQHSVMPYRIPGALDRFDWPMLQVLHVEKRGLQFHETCINVWGRWAQPQPIPSAVSFSHNDRRLFQYRFRETGERAALPESLIQRISALVPPSGQRAVQSDLVKPVRAWNADLWYVNNVENPGLRVYDTTHGPAPPKEVVDLFRDLEALPRRPANWVVDERADVCLGFCYDPLSGLGRLFANDRCFNAGHGTVCR